MNVNRALLMSELEAEEGCRDVVYDDANGQPIKPGSWVRGHPTTGIGWALDTNPCPRELALYILGYFLDRSNVALLNAAPWIGDLPEPCQRALCDMALELGVEGLLGFDTFMLLMKTGSFATAAKDLETTDWWKEVGTRGPRIQALILQGVST